MSSWVRPEHPDPFFLCARFRSWGCRGRISVEGGSYLHINTCYRQQLSFNVGSNQLDKYLFAVRILDKLTAQANWVPRVHQGLTYG